MTCLEHTPCDRRNGAGAAVAQALRTHFPLQLVHTMQCNRALSSEWVKSAVRSAAATMLPPPCSRGARGRLQRSAGCRRRKRRPCAVESSADRDLYLTLHCGCNIFILSKASSGAGSKHKRRTSHVTRHTSHVTRHTSLTRQHVARHRCRGGVAAHHACTPQLAVRCARVGIQIRYYKCMKHYTVAVS